MKDNSTPFYIRLSNWLNNSNTALDERMTFNQESNGITASRDNEALLNKAEQEEQERIQNELKTWNEKKGILFLRSVYSILAVLICIFLIGLMLYTCAQLPEYGNPSSPVNNVVSQRYIEKGLQETGAVNIVTGMILDYRAFDTLGESTVLFTAAMVVLLLLRIDSQSHRYSSLARSMKNQIHSDMYYEPSDDMILAGTARVLIPIILLFGIYVVLNGHLSPGGGFSGGAIMGAGLILYLTAYGFEKTHGFFTNKTYQFTVLISLMTYALSKCYSFYTGANGIHSVIPLGTPGAILSSGLILVLNICVGFIVTCTMYAFYAIFRKGEL